jgi:hypothetical protein
MKEKPFRPRQKYDFIPTNNLVMRFNLIHFVDLDNLALNELASTFNKNLKTYSKPYVANHRVPLAGFEPPSLDKDGP